MDLKPLPGMAQITGPMPAPAAPADHARKAREFEAAMLAPMVGDMLKTAGDSAMGGGQSAEIWRSFIAGAIAQEIAQTGSTGIADVVARQMKAYEK